MNLANVIKQRQMNQQAKSNNSDKSRERIVKNKTKNPIMLKWNICEYLKHSEDGLSETNKPSHTNEYIWIDANDVITCAFHFYFTVDAFAYSIFQLLLFFYFINY